MRQKRIALINDITGYSRCSIAAQLPIISAMSIECVFIQLIRIIQIIFLMIIQVR